MVPLIVSPQVQSLLYTLEIGKLKIKLLKTRLKYIIDHNDVNKMPTKIHDALDALSTTKM